MAIVGGVLGTIDEMANEVRQGFGILSGTLLGLFDLRVYSVRELRRKSWP
jgi:hypothetical protein